MHRVFFIPACNRKHLSKRNSGTWLWASSMLAGVAELIGLGVVAVIAGEMRSYTGVCLAGPAAWSLCGSIVDRDVFLHHECTYEKKMFRTNGKD